MLEELLNKIVPYIISILECIGVFIIAYSSLKTFYLYLRNKLHSDSHEIKLDFARSLAFALEFKLGGEILRTVITKNVYISCNYSTACYPHFCHPLGN